MNRDQEIEALRAEVASLSALVAEHERLEAEQSIYMERLLAQREARARSAELAATFQAMSEGVVVIDAEGRVVSTNPTAVQILGDVEVGASLNAIHVLFDEDGVVPIPEELRPTGRALGGERVEGFEAIVKSPFRPQGIWLLISSGPILNEQGVVTGAVIAFNDIDERKRWEQERTELLKQLRDDVRELSTPILEVWDDILALPVIGSVDERRTALMMERLLQAIVEKQSRFVLLDITGVDHVDTHAADRLLKLVQAVELLGARCLLTGARAAVAQTLVSLGFDTTPLVTLGTLKHGLKECLRQMAESNERSRRAGSIRELALGAKAPRPKL